MLSIIPARGGSKGVKNKNIKILNGKPLIAYSIECCLNCKNIERVIVSTDSLEIANIARQFGAEVPFMRPKEFARDDSKDEEFLNHFFDNFDVEDVVFIRPTTPFRKIEVIEKAIDTYLNVDFDFTGFRSMQAAEENPYKMFQINSHGVCEGFFKDFKGEKDYTNLPRQKFPEAYRPNGYVDIVKQEIVRRGSAFGDVIVPFITPRVPDIDTEEDFKFAEIFSRNE